MLVAGVAIPSNKNLFIALTYVYGIGKYTANKICIEAGVDPLKRVSLLSASEIMKINECIKSYTIEGELRKNTMMDIRRLKAINCYRGLRHKRALPVNGQRTHTNAKTSKKLLKITSKK